MPLWCWMFQQTLDGSARGWFERLPHDSINEWAELREAFAARFSVRRACFKEPHEITKIIEKANESLTAFKKDKVPTTVTEMMERLDDFVRSEEAYASTDLPKGEPGSPITRYLSLSIGGVPVRSKMLVWWSREEMSLEIITGEEMYTEILATETQLRLSVPRPMLNPLRSGNADQYYDYHQEKGHYTNDYIQLRKRLEISLESGKLNHLVKDVRQRGRVSHGRDNPQQAKIINVISVNSVKDNKRKVWETTESWMNIPISFWVISSEDVSKEPLIVKAEMEGYLVRWVYVDEGSSAEVMFKHYFENLIPKIKDRLRKTQTDIVGFAREVSKPLGKIELEVCFGNEGLYKRTSMMFIVVRAPSPYNIILGRPGLNTLRAIPFIIHSMMKFPTPKGVATLVTRTVIIAECRRLE
nr:reverse transcriptase domain-containing protein [Tanacetum cinerariifolium]GFA00039.1 reverse transcriptase domain-containing protein [Tanacetum cinerariifolium]